MREGITNQTEQPLFSLVDRDGHPLAATPSLQVPEASFEPISSPSFVQQSGSALLGADGFPLVSGNDRPVIQVASSADYQTLGLDVSKNDASLPSRRNEILEAVINPFRSAARFFEGLVVGGERGAAWIGYVAKLLNARTAAVEQLRDSMGSERGVETAQQLYISRGPESSEQDFASSIGSYEYRERGELRTSETRTSGPIEAVGQAAIRFVLEDDVARGTAVGVIVADTVSQMLRESRIQYHQDGEKTPLTATPQLRSLSAICVTALEQDHLNKALRNEFYDILAQVELSDGMAERILNIQASHQERLGPGEIRSDITHPTSLHFYTLALKEQARTGEEVSGFVASQRRTGEALITELSRVDSQSLFDRFDELLNRASTLVHAGAGREDSDPVTGRNIGVEFEYSERNDGWTKGPHAWNRYYDRSSREISLQKDFISYNPDWVDNLAGATSFIKDEANGATLSTRFSMHVHIDQATCSSKQASSLFSAFFHDPTRRSPVNNNDDYQTWEVRGLVVPDVGGCPHPARVLDTARLVALTPESRLDGAKEVVALSDKPYSGANLVWGHVLASTADPEARLAALCALTDSRTFAVFDPGVLSDSYDESSHTLLARESRYHIRDIPLLQIKEKQCRFTLNLWAAQQSHPDEPIAIPTDLKREIVQAFGICLSDQAGAPNQPLMEYLTQDDGRLNEFLTATIQCPTSTSMKAMAIRVLKDMNAGPALVPVMLGQLASDSWEDRQGALLWFATVPHLASDHVGEVFRLTNDSDSDVREAARNLIVAIPGAMADNLSWVVANCTHSSWSVRRDAARMLGADPELARSQSDLLFQLLDDGDDDVRKAAAAALLKVPDVVRSQENLVGRALTSAHGETREAAVEMLLADGTMVARHTERLGEMIFDPNSLVVNAVGRALADFPEELARHEVGLQERLSSDLWRARRDAVLILAVDKGVASRHLNDFVRMLGDSDSDVRESALNALKSTSGGIVAAESHFAELLTSPSWSRRYEAINLLASDQTVARRHVREFERLTRDDDSDVRRAARTALAGLGLESARGEDGRPPVENLGGRGENGSAPVERGWNLRERAAQALEMIGGWFQRVRQWFARNREED